MLQLLFLNPLQGVSQSHILHFQCALLPNLTHHSPLLGPTRAQTKKAHNEADDRGRLREPSGNHTRGILKGGSRFLPAVVFCRVRTQRPASPTSTYPSIYRTRSSIVFKNLARNILVPSQTTAPHPNDCQVGFTSSSQCVGVLPVKNCFLFRVLWSGSEDLRITGFQFVSFFETNPCIISFLAYLDVQMERSITSRIVGRPTETSAAMLSQDISFAKPTHPPAQK